MQQQGTVIPQQYTCIVTITPTTIYSVIDMQLCYITNNYLAITVMYYMSLFYCYCSILAICTDLIHVWVCKVLLFSCQSLPSFSKLSLVSRDCIDWIQTQVFGYYSNVEQQLVHTKHCNKTEYLYETQDTVTRHSETAVNDTSLYTV